ncbi:MAG: biopolymer transporter ExbD [Gammaproteobacteria bacterium HGW-Gammaproteobacteria-1]|jgi:biopolymer transport protein ExbD|nr:MAG: biopolymer transporter ExbD [Gammaproteobacteria bacterium HGW-Gammaproteobacteria-1]
METSRRARRMERHHSRNKPAGLNLVALMDIFTILVFFLLVNSSDVQEMPSSRAVKLPESNIESKVRQTVTVLVTRDDIIVQGQAVQKVSAALADNDNILQPLKAALEEQARNRLLQGGAEQDRGEVTILGDRALPFQLLKKVMATCTESGYGTVSLAVQQRGVKES